MVRYKSAFWNTVSDRFLTQSIGREEQSKSMIKQRQEVLSTLSHLWPIVRHNEIQRWTEISQTILTKTTADVEMSTNFKLRLYHMNFYLVFQPMSLFQDKYWQYLYNSCGRCTYNGEVKLRADNSTGRVATEEFQSIHGPLKTCDRWLVNTSNRVRLQLLQPKYTRTTTDTDGMPVITMATTFWVIFAIGVNVNKLHKAQYNK